MSNKSKLINNNQKLNSNNIKLMVIKMHFLNHYQNIMDHQLQPLEQILKLLLISTQLIETLKLSKLQDMEQVMIENLVIKR